MAQQPPETLSPRRAPAGITRPMQASVSRLPISAQASMSMELPPLPEGVEELKFADFYKLPVGPCGLEPSAKLLALDGKKVRLSGFFVFEDWSTCSCPPTPAPTVALSPAAARRAAAQPVWMKHVVPGRIMLSPVPTTVSLGHYGLCDDLPPQVAFLEIVPKFGEPVFYQPGTFAVIGTLSLKSKEEPDGRTSYVHVKVERDADILRLGKGRTPAPAPTGAAVPVAAAVSGPAR
jgi:hypothetical protein